MIWLAQATSVRQVLPIDSVASGPQAIATIFFCYVFFISSRGLRAEDRFLFALLTMIYMIRGSFFLR